MVNICRTARWWELVSQSFVHRMNRSVTRKVSITAGQRDRLVNISFTVYDGVSIVVFGLRYLALLLAVSFCFHCVLGCVGSEVSLAVLCDVSVLHRERRWRGTTNERRDTTKTKNSHRQPTRPSTSTTHRSRAGFHHGINARVQSRITHQHSNPARTSRAPDQH